MGTAIKHPVPDRVKPYVICNFDIRAQPTCQKLQMMAFTRSGTECFIAVAMWQLNHLTLLALSIVSLSDKVYIKETIQRYRIKLVSRSVLCEKCLLYTEQHQACIVKDALSENL